MILTPSLISHQKVGHVPVILNLEKPVKNMVEFENLNIISYHFMSSVIFALIKLYNFLNLQYPSPFLCNLVICGY